jgi:hypothetical protein
MYGERAAVLRPLVNGSAVDLHARKAIVVIIKVDIETVGRSQPIEVPTVNIDRPQPPGVTCWHDEIVR